jgi:hypothetical protein
MAKSEPSVTRVGRFICCTSAAATSLLDMSKVVYAYHSEGTAKFFCIGDEFGQETTIKVPQGSAAFEIFMAYAQESQ